LINKWRINHLVLLIKNGKRKKKRKKLLDHMYDLIIDMLEVKILCFFHKLSLVLINSDNPRIPLSFATLYHDHCSFASKGSGKKFLFMCFLH